VPVGGELREHAPVAIAGGVHNDRVMPLLQDGLTA
jgi:hypothetical protein